MFNQQLVNKPQNKIQGLFYKIGQFIFVYHLEDLFELCTNFWKFCMTKYQKFRILEYMINFFCVFQKQKLRKKEVVNQKLTINQPISQTQR
ncbi:hypothetical protein pb186bvf_017720 [Paramecium bursaria]